MSIDHETILHVLPLVLGIVERRGHYFRLHHASSIDADAEAMDRPCQVGRQVSQPDDLLSVGDRTTEVTRPMILPSWITR
jgi:hypothetical protein